MKILTAFEQVDTQTQTAALTLGNFDGVHLGHQRLLREVVRLSGSEGLATAISFRTHPSLILKQREPTPLICPLPHKIQLLQELGIKSLFLLEFTPELARLSAAEFIDQIRRHLRFHRLILGENATLGREREGNAVKMRQIADSRGFELLYLPVEDYENVPISSSRIREAIQLGDLKLLENLLGRPYSICGTVMKGAGEGKKMGYPTLNLSLEGLCLPPFGVYTAQVRHHQAHYSAIVNLGVAPTLNQSRTPLLEVHLIEPFPDNLKNWLEVVFTRFVRPEKKFESKEQLALQIQQDLKPENQSL